MSDSRSFSGRFSLFLLVVLFVKCESKIYAYAILERLYHGFVDMVVYQVNDSSEIPRNYIVKGVYDNQINSTGWAFLELYANEEVDYSDDIKAIAAGKIEGVLTSDLIWMHWENTIKGMCKDKKRKIGNHINTYLSWTALNYERNFLSDPYLNQVFLYERQLRGLAEGYLSTVTDMTKGLGEGDLFALNMLGDFKDILDGKDEDREAGTGRCSALIKMLPDGSDVFVAHETWKSYQSMLRIQKKYVLKYRILPLTEPDIYIPGHTMSFSSYPGVLSSGDDFYITSANLVTQKTTIGNSNKEFVSPTQQMEFIKSMVANRLAGSGKNWIDIFRKNNNGIYNNQWMVVDYKMFAPGTNTPENLKPGFLWILEQIPGAIEAQDMTSLLKKQGYWPSYNIAYFPNIFNMSGGPESVKKYGDWFTYDKNPRAQIFKRDQGKIRNMDDMYAMMRYNDFMHDPLSRCDCDPLYNAENSIAARNDLNKVNGTYPFKDLGHRSHGATDTKVTNRHLATTFQFLSVSGPTHNASRGLPPFRWSEVDFGNSTPHVGHPDLWQFNPLTYKWEW